MEVCFNIYIIYTHTYIHTYSYTRHQQARNTSYLFPPSLSFFPHPKSSFLHIDEGSISKVPQMKIKKEHPQNYTILNQKLHIHCIMIIFSICNIEILTS